MGNISLNHSKNQKRDPNFFIQHHFYSRLSSNLIKVLSLSKCMPFLKNPTVFYFFEEFFIYIQFLWKSLDDWFFVSMFNSVSWLSLNVKFCYSVFNRLIDSTLGTAFSNFDAWHCFLCIHYVETKFQAMFYTYLHNELHSKNVH